MRPEKETGSPKHDPCMKNGAGEKVTPTKTGVRQKKTANYFYSRYRLEVSATFYTRYPHLNLDAIDLVT
ncbi:hypothetical protein evm_004676 [Chilo suppressalis]|nr:hypothetical protein evm_004676 [Chilo suppressalis]